MIVLDGLDEAEGYSNPRRNILKMLPGADLPANVRFVLSSRPGEHLTRGLLNQACTFWLSEDAAGHQDDRALDDARDYLVRLTSDERVEEMIVKRGIAPKALVGRVAAASQGNFLYLHHYAQGLRGGFESLLDLEALPKGLKGIYSNFLGAIKQRREDVSWNRAYKPVLGTLAVAQAPLTRANIASFSGVRPSTVGTILARVKQFLDATKAGELQRYAIYHSSFGEYLVSEENEDYIDGKEAHALIVNHYRRSCHGDWATQAREGYMRRHLATHLAGAGLDEELYSLISRKWWVARVLGDGYTQNGFLSDIDSAWRRSLAQEDPHLPTLVRLNTGRLIVGHYVSAYRDRDLQTLVWLYRENEATAHARLREGCGARYRGLLAIFEALSERGDPDVALLDAASDAALGIEDRSDRDTSLARVVVALARHGFRDKAVGLVEHVEPGKIRVEALLQAAADCGEAESALVEDLVALAYETARAIPRDWPAHVEALLNVANAMLEHRVGAAVEVCEEVSAAIRYRYDRYDAERKLAAP